MQAAGISATLGSKRSRRQVRVETYDASTKTDDTPTETYDSRTETYDSRAEAFG
jgi:hypothetical protein